MSSTEIIFLGTGNAFHSDGRLSQSILIRNRDVAWCVDAGPTFLYQLEKFRIDPASIEQFFFTHFHGDHTAGISFFLLHLYEFAQDHRDVVINGPSGITECCRKHYLATYPEIILDEHVRYREFPVEEKAGISLEHDNSLQLIPMVHKPESLGFRFTFAGKKIAVTGDTKWNPAVTRLAEGADLAVIECTTMQREHFNHISFDEFSENLDSINSGLIVPVHLTDEIASAFKKLQHPRIRIVEDGDKLLLND